MVTLIQPIIDLLASACQGVAFVTIAFLFAALLSRLMRAFT